MPEWLMPSLAKARKTREDSEALDEKMAKIVQDRLTRGEQTSSFIAGMLTRESEGVSELNEFERNTLAGMFVSSCCVFDQPDLLLRLVAAAVDTTQASIHCLILGFMCEYSISS